MLYSQMSKEQLQAEKTALEKQYADFKAKGLKLDMSRGKPAPEQLTLSLDMLLHCLDGDYKSSNGIDCRNYGVLDGIPEAKALFQEMLGVSADEVIVGGNSSLQMMYDTIIRALQLGVLGSEKPCCRYNHLKFLSPTPRYDRHYAICQAHGIEPLVTITHFDCPIHLIKEYGGWRNRKLIDFYKNLATTIITRNKRHLKYKHNKNENKKKLHQP